MSIPTPFYPLGPAFFPGAKILNTVSHAHHVARPRGSRSCREPLSKQLHGDLNCFQATVSPLGFRLSSTTLYYSTILKLSSVIESATHGLNNFQGGLIENRLLLRPSVLILGGCFGVVSMVSLLLNESRNSLAYYFIFGGSLILFFRGFGNL